jgi:hypothetical protein
MAYAPIDPNELAAFHQTLTAPQQQSHAGNFLTHLIPTIGGTGGAIGGAALGTAIAPGIGTLLGALLGGATGGAAGKVGENAAEHQKLTNGVAGQAVEQGVLGAGPLRLAKLGTVGVKAGAEALGAGEGLAGALTAAGERANTPLLGNTAKNLVTQGQAAQGRVSGISAGQKIANKELTPQDTATMLQTLQNEGIKTGNANNTLRDVQAKLDQYGSQISDHFTGNNTPLSKTDVNNIARDYVKSIGTSDPRVVKEANVIANDLKNSVTDTKGLWEFRKGLDSRIPDSKMAAGDNVLSNQLKAVKAGRQFLADKLGAVDGMQQYHDLSEIKPFISAEAKRLNNPGGGLIGRVAASGPVQKAEGSLGKATEHLGNALGGGESPTAGLTPGAIASRTVPIGAAQALAQSSPAQNAATQSPQTTGLSPDLTAALLNAQQQPTNNSPYSQDNLMADIQRDPKHASDYISTYSALDKIFNPQPSSSSTIKPTSQQYGLAQGGMNSLQQLAQLISNNPSIVERNATPGQGLPLVGSLITNAAGAGDYHALSDNVLQSLIHLETGATATPEEVKAAKGQLPQPGDSAQLQQQKIQNLMTLFQPYIQGNSGNAANSGSSSDLINALLASGYGQ